MFGFFKRGRNDEERQNELTWYLEEIKDRLQNVENQLHRQRKENQELCNLLKQVLNINNDTTPQSYSQGQYDRLMQLQQQLNAQVGNLVMDPVEIPEEFREVKRSK